MLPNRSWPRKEDQPKARQSQPISSLLSHLHIDVHSAATKTSAAAVAGVETAKTSALRKHLRNINAFGPVEIVSAVVAHLLLWVREDSVRLANLLELRFVAPFVWVMEQTLFAIRLFDMVLASVPIDPQDLVIVLGLALLTWPNKPYLVLGQIDWQIKIKNYTYPFEIDLGLSQFFFEAGLVC
jgi:hypothetical protein